MPFAVTHWTHIQLRRSNGRAGLRGPTGGLRRRLTMAYYLNGRYKDTIRILERLIRQNPDYQYGHVVLAATYGKLGRLDEQGYH